MSNLRYCIVPSCKNTAKNKPTMEFINVPKDTTRRKLWLEAAGRKADSLSEKSCLHVCEDHFNLKEDLQNYMEFKLTGAKKRIKPHVVPHKLCGKDLEQADLQQSTFQILEVPVQHQFQPSVTSQDIGVPIQLKGNSENWIPTSLEKKRKQKNLDRLKSSEAKKKLIREEQPSCSNTQTEPLATVYLPSNNYSSSLKNTNRESVTKLKTEIGEHELLCPQVCINEEKDPLTILDTTEESLVTKIKTEPDEIEQEITDEIDLQSPIDATTNFEFIAMPKLENRFQ